MEPGTPSPTYYEDEPYTGAPVVGAVLGTIFFPFLSLIAALILQGAETSPRKKAQLRTWAWVSGGWLAFGVLIAVLMFIAFFVAAHQMANSLGRPIYGSDRVKPRSAPCLGGPKNNATARHVRGNLYAIPCKFGGTTTVPIVIPGH